MEISVMCEVAGGWPCGHNSKGGWSTPFRTVKGWEGGGVT